MTPAPGRETVHWIDERVGAAGFARKALRYVFPDHWSFLLGEIALYAFVFLVISGTFLALNFSPSTAEVRYVGSFAPLDHQVMSEAYRSTLHLSFDVPGGLLIRQAHHWAALVFVAAITLHVMRIFFTGAFRKPRDLNYFVGVTLLALAILEGFCGYSMPDDLLSGMGLAIAYGVAMSIPIVGGKVAFLVWGGQFPGSDQFITRLFALHVFVLPAVIGLLIVVHLAMIVRLHHAQFPGPGRTERNVVGTPMWPAYALRSLGLMMAVFGVLVLMGGLIQINPIWHWGPYEPWRATNGAQPDWYLGWLIGALRMMPPLEIRLFGHVLVPNPFWGGVLFPSVVFAVMYAWPALERRFSRDRARHDLLDRPRDNPSRTAAGAAFFAWIFTVFAFGAGDRILVSVGFPYESQLWVFRACFFLAPPVTFFVVRRVCRELRTDNRHPLRGWTGTRVRRTPDGGFEEAR